jgi:hypothetical protein
MGRHWPVCISDWQATHPPQQDVGLCGCGLTTEAAAELYVFDFTQLLLHRITAL